MWFIWALWESDHNKVPSADALKSRISINLLQRWPALIYGNFEIYIINLTFFVRKKWGSHY